MLIWGKSSTRAVIPTALSRHHAEPQQPACGVQWGAAWAPGSRSLLRPPETCPMERGTENQVEAAFPPGREGRAAGPPSSLTPEHPEAGARTPRTPRVFSTPAALSLAVPGPDGPAAAVHVDGPRCQGHSPCPLLRPCCVRSARISLVWDFSVLSSVKCLRRGGCVGTPPLTPAADTHSAAPHGRVVWAGTGKSGHVNPSQRESVGPQ